MLEPNDRFLRRQWLMQHLDVLLREVVYHRAVEEDENLPSQVWWRVD